MASDDLTTLRRLFRANAWANGECLVSVVEAADPPPRVSAVLGHLAGTEMLWLSRLRGEPPPPVWPDLSPAAAEAVLAELAGSWQAELDGAAATGLGREVSYRNSQGEHFTSAAGDILWHVLLHAAYHRGQIAAALREAGQRPAYTDFIHGVRSGALGD